MTTILVLTEQEELFSEINNSLSPDYDIHLANTTSQISNVLVAETARIAFIDSALLTDDNRQEIVDALSFFPEVPLIALVESGETQNLVTLFESFNIYRYLQKPFTAEQVKTCVTTATRKQQKSHAPSPVHNEENALSTKNSKLIAITSLIVFVLIAAYFTLFNNHDPEVEPDATLVQQESIPAKNTAIKEKKEQPDEILENKITELLDKADAAIKSDNLFAPVEINALHFYMKALEIAPDNEAIKLKLNQLHTEISKNISSHLSNSKYNKAISAVKTIKKNYPEYNQVSELDNLLEEQGKIFFLEADALIKKKQYDSASIKLSLASTLTKEYTDKIKESKQRIISLIQKNKETTQLISIINSRITKNQLIEPENDNAGFYIKKLEQMSPNESSIKNIHSQYSTALLSKARKTTEYDNIDKAKSLLLEARKLNINIAEVNNIEKQLALTIKNQQNTKLEQQQLAQILELSDLADKAIESNKLLYPAEKSAKFYLLQAIELDPDNTHINSRIDTLVKLLIIQINTDINESTFASASSKLSLTKELGKQTEALLALENKLKKAIESR